LQFAVCFGSQQRCECLGGTFFPFSPPPCFGAYL